VIEARRRRTTLGKPQEQPLELEVTADVELLAALDAGRPGRRPRSQPEVTPAASGERCPDR
jgi:hypothetical protein